MAIKELSGRKRFLEGIEAGLSGEFSAVIVRSGVDNSVVRSIRDARDKHRPLDLTRGILNKALPLAASEKKIEQWASKKDRVSQGLASVTFRFGRVEAHIDEDWIALALSLGMGDSRAQFRTQLLGDRVPRLGVINFDEGAPIDEFEQGLGDIVFMPGVPNQTIHEVDADFDRAAAIMRYHTQPNDNVTTDLAVVGRGM